MYETLFLILGIAAGIVGTIALQPYLTKKWGKIWPVLSIDEQCIPENEHVILVAFTVFGHSMKNAQLELLEALQRLPWSYHKQNGPTNIESHWIAMDERYDRSDCDSAEFVPGSGVKFEGSYRG